MNNNNQRLNLTTTAQSVVDYIYATAQQYADNTAVITATESISYQRLNQRSNQLAHYLQHQGIGRDSVVALLFNRSIDMLIAIFAIAKAGGAYLPLSSAMPVNRQVHILTNSNARLLIVGDDITPSELWPTPVCSVNQADIAALPLDDLEQRPHAEDLAYVIYTSGSTGEPKGVAVEHGALLNRITWMQDEYPISSTDVLFQKTVYTFDVSVWEMFWWAMYGAAVVLLPSGLENDPRTLARLIQRHQISVVHFVPSVLNLFIEYLSMKADPQLTASLRYLFASGEKLTSYTVKGFYQVVSHSQLINLYGPTEAAIDVSHYCCDPTIDYHDIPIGQAISGCRLYILDEQLHPVADGQEGELYIAGIGLARGYLNNPQLTDKSFFIHPQLSVDGKPERLYKTGDLVYCDVNRQAIHYIGRNDFQIKLRGLRIELGEIEAALLTDAQVGQAAVIADQEDPQHQLIYAFVTGSPALDLLQLKAQLATQIADYMLPARLIALAQLPCLANGKLDRHQLLAIARQQSTICVDLRPQQQPQWLTLSSVQESMWFMQQLSPDSALYNNPAALRIEGALDKQRLQQAIMQLMQRHQLLRARPALRDGTPGLQIMPLSANTPILSEIKPDLSTTSLSAWVNDRVSQPMPLTAETRLCYFELVIEDENHHLLLIHLHHIISDGWSKGIIISELQAFYNHEAPELPAQTTADVDYADYLQQQQHYYASDLYHQDLDYWRTTLAGELPILNLATDKPRRLEHRHNGGFIAFQIPLSTSLQVTEAARKMRVTLYNYLLSVFVVLLERNARQQEYIVGMPIAGRLSQEMEGIVGPLINVLPVRVAINDQMRFTDLVAQVRKTLFGAYRHQRIGFEQISRALKVDWSDGHFPIYQSMFQLDNMPLPSANLNGLEISPVLLDTGASQVDISLSMQYLDQQLSGTFEYDSGLYVPQRIQYLIDQFIYLLEQVSATPEICVDQLLAVNQQELQWFALQNDTAVLLPPVNNIVQLILPYMVETPQAIAISTPQQVANYSQLSQAVSQYYGWLTDLGVNRGDQVPVMLSTSLELVAVQLALLALGAVYIPLDGDAPIQRNRTILSVISPRLLLTATEWLGELNTMTAAQVVVVPDWHTLQQPSDTSNHPHFTTVAGADAVIIFTSGTTGVPKGVRLTHHNLINLVQSFISSYQVTAADSLLPITSLASASFVGEVLPILAAGGKLLLAEKTVSLDTQHLIDTLVKEKVTIVSTAPSLSARLSSLAQVPGALRLFLCGGEAVDHSQIAPLLATMQVVNGYGSTESGICSTYHVITSQELAEKAPIPIGRPIQNTQLYIVDSSGRLLPPGVHGELCIAGEGISPGYLNDEQNSQCFSQLNEVPDIRVVKTGDMARWNSDGELIYLGRQDRQVQIRGHRVELGEVESLLKQHPELTEAYVDVRYNAAQEPTLVAFYTSVGNVAVEARQLRVWLSMRLPLYMLPLLYVPLDAMPMSVNDKIEAKRLPSVDLRQIDSGHDYLPPATEIERQLADIWCRLLGQDRVSVETNFFDLGGHSLLLVQMQQLINQQFHLVLPLVELMRFTTIRRLADFLNTPAEHQSDNRTSEPQRTQQQRNAFASARWVRGSGR